ncbi:MAG: hypothetical protein HOM21_06915, partial [Halobacteriovoraceae bacterium]|nr:hypothetical protein [Halobacteriovoraceae bacterium]
FKDIFKGPKPILAAVMLEGDLTTEKNRKAVLKKALDQLKIAQDEGVDSILYEFRGGGILKPAVTDLKLNRMVAITKEIIKRAKNVVIGVEILWHYPEDTLKLAARSGAKYVRVDFFSDDMIADGTRVPLNPEGLKVLQKKLGAEKIALFTDIQVKYAKMVDKNITVAQSAARAEILGSQGMIVTGEKSGHPPQPGYVARSRKGITNSNIIIGSGFDFKNAKGLMQHADAAIVGTSISTKTGGVLIPAKVRKLMKVVREIRKEAKNSL